jgi:hypothetical protein
MHPNHKGKITSTEGYWLPYPNHGEEVKASFVLPRNKVCRVTGIHLTSDFLPRLCYAGRVSLTIGGVQVEKNVQARRYSPHEGLGYFFDLKPCSEDGQGFLPQDYTVNIVYTDKFNPTMAGLEFTPYNVEAFFEILET